MQKFFERFKKPSTLLILIIIISVLTRLAGALFLGDKVEEMPGIFDQISYDLLARRVLGGYGFSFGQTWWPVTAAGAPTAHWSYFYTLYLVVIYAIFGLHPLAARIIQAIIFGILQPYLTYRIGNRLFGKSAGLIAALLSAGYAYFIYYGGSLMTEPFYILAILLVMDISTHLAKDPDTEKKVGYWLYLGAVFGIGVLLRQVFLLMVPFILLWIGWAIYRRKRSIPFLRMVLPIVVIAAMIIPFTIYNTSRFGKFVMLNTNAGYAFFWGNHPYYGTDFQPILPSEVYKELIPDELLGLDEAALDSALLTLAKNNILDDPGRYILLSISRVPDFFMFWPSADSSRISNISRVASFGILWPFMLAGVILSLVSIRGKISEMLASQIFLPILFMVLYSGLHILTWTLIRYRLPVDAVALIFAGYILAELDRRYFHIGRRVFQISETSESHQGTEQ